MASGLAAYVSRGWLPIPAQDSLPGAPSGSPGRAFTRRAPAKGFQLTSCSSSSFSKLAWHNPFFFSNGLRPAGRPARALRLTVAPIPGPSFCVGDGDNMNAMVAVAEDNLKWELRDTTRTMPVVDPNESFGIGLNSRQRDVDGNAEVASGGGTALCVSIRRCLQFGCGFGMETNSHCQRRASRTIVRGCPPNLR